jgi:hypothetical protein
VLALVAAAWWALPADALTEARILDVTCGGLRIVQTGLPPDTLFEAEAIDAVDGRVLTEREVRSTADGGLDVRLTADLHGVHRLHGEVSRAADDEEYGEADVDLNAHCRIVGRKPLSPSTPGSSSVPAPSGRAAAPSPAADQPHDPAGDDHWLSLGILAAAVGAFGAGLFLLARRRRGAS